MRLNEVSPPIGSFRTLWNSTIYFQKVKKNIEINHGSIKNVGRTNVMLRRQKNTFVLILRKCLVFCE